MSDGEPSGDGCYHLFTFVFEKVGDRVLGGDDELGVTERSLSALELPVGLPFVGPDLEVVEEAVRIEVVKNDNILAGVTIPPLGLVFYIRIRVVCACLVCFACA